MRRNTYMLRWWIDEINYLIYLINNKKQFPNYYYQSLYNALEEYYFLKDIKKDLDD